MFKSTDRDYEAFIERVTDRLCTGDQKYGDKYLRVDQRQFIEEKVARIGTFDVQQDLEDLAEIAGYTYLWSKKILSGSTPPVGVLYSLTGQTAQSLTRKQLIRGSVEVHSMEDLKYASGMFGLWGVRYVLSIGCMLKIPNWFIAEYMHRIFNLHPGKLPRFKGKDPHKLAIKEKPCVTGVTIHEVTPKIDSGEILAELPVWVRKDDDEQTLYATLKATGQRLTEMFIQNYLT